MLFLQSYIKIKQHHTTSRQMLFSDNNKLSAYSLCAFKIIKTTALILPQAIIVSDFHGRNGRIV